jgi:hypothetical protein
MGKYTDMVRAMTRKQTSVVSVVSVVTPNGGSEVRSREIATPQDAFRLYDQNDRNDKSPMNRALADLEARCPDRVDSDRWRQAVEDGRRFLAEWGEQATALGWTAADLFGLHLTVPLARYDGMGLVWLLRGRRVVALTDTDAKIKTETGAVTYRRARGAPGEPSSKA